MKNFLILFLLSAGSILKAQESGMPDYLFPEKGKSSISFYSGIPYVVIAEFSYGFSEKFSLGLVAGTTPKVPGIGLRLKAVLFEQDPSFRLHMKMPVFYYLKTQGLGGEPWFLSWPSLNSEWKLKSGVRISAGIGLVAAACANDLLGIENHEHATHSHEEHLEFISHEAEEGFMGGLWNTVQVGAAIPLGLRSVLQTEFALVGQGLKIASEDWVGGPPVILTFGFSYSLNK